MIKNCIVKSEKDSLYPSLIFCGMSFSTGKRFDKRKVSWYPLGRSGFNSWWLLDFFVLFVRILEIIDKNWLCHFFAGSLDPWVPLDLDSKYHCLDLSVCFQLDPWIPGSHGQKKAKCLFLIGSLDPLIPRPRKTRVSFLAESLDSRIS